MAVKQQSYAAKKGVILLKLFIFVRGIKKTNPTEFLLTQRVLWHNVTPTTYFTQFRFELFFQRLIFWFFQHYGFFLMLTKIKLEDSRVLLHLFYYKTFMFIGAQRLYQVQNKAAALPTRLKGLRRKKPLFRKAQFSTLQKYVIYCRQKQRRQNVLLGVKSKTPGTLVAQSILLFFHYFVLQWWESTAVIIAKPLLPYLSTQLTFQDDLQFLSWKAEYLLSYSWSFDFLFFLNCTFFFYNTNFLFPFLVVHLLTVFKHFKYLLMFVNLVEKLYVLKEVIQGVKIVVRGPYDRHGRTKVYHYILGHIIINSSSTRVMYDMIHCPTFYGMVSLKFWVYYSRPIWIAAI